MKAFKILLILSLMPLSAGAATVCTNDNPNSKKPGFMYFPNPMDCPLSSKNVSFGGFKYKKVNRAKYKTNEKGERVVVLTPDKIRIPRFYLVRTNMDETTCKYSSPDKKINMTCERGVSAARMLEIGKKIKNRRLIELASIRLKKSGSESVTVDALTTSPGEAPQSKR